MGNFDVVSLLHAVRDITSSNGFSTYLIGNTVSFNYYPRHGNLCEISLVNTVVRKGLTPSLEISLVNTVVRKRLTRSLSHTKLVAKLRYRSL